MPVQRGYRDACGIAHALDLVGERWALLVVRELLFGAKRFVDLRRGMPAASPNALTARLRELTEMGVVRRRRLPPPAASWVYELTEWGRELEPILTALGTWGVRSSRLDPTGHLSTASVMLTIRTYFQPDPEQPAVGSVEVRLSGEDRFCVVLGPGGADTQLELRADPDAVVSSDPATLIAVLGDSEQLSTAVGDGSLRIDGDGALARRLLLGVAVPEPAPIEARR